MTVIHQRKNTLTRNRLAEVRDRQRHANLNLLVEFILGRVFQQVAVRRGSDIDITLVGYGHGIRDGRRTGNHSQRLNVTVARNQHKQVRAFPARCAVHISVGRNGKRGDARLAVRNDVDRRITPGRARQSASGARPRCRPRHLFERKPQRRGGRQWQASRSTRYFINS